MYENRSNWAWSQVSTLGTPFSARSELCWVLPSLVPARKAIEYSMNSNGTELNKSFTHIQHRARAVDQEGFVKIRLVPWVSPSRLGPSSVESCQASCRHEKLSSIVWTATVQNWTSRSHTSNIVQERLTKRVLWTKSQSYLLNVYFRLNRVQSWLLSINFRYGPNACSHCTEAWHQNYPLCDTPL